MTREVDLATIDAFMRDAAARAVADAIRAQTGQLEPLHVLDDPRQPELAMLLGHPNSISRFSALSAPVTAPAEPRRATVYPVPVEQPGCQLGWWDRHWHHVAIGVIATAGACGAVYLVILAVTALLSALVTAVMALVPVLIGILAVVVLIALLAGGRGGGRDFSGTFQGRLH
jgi:hypothetical protein